jgi:hypothetical protein
VKEADVLKTILGGLAAKRIFAIRMNQGVSRVGKRYIPFNSAGRGTADILAFLRHEIWPQSNTVAWTITPLWLEVKSDAGRQSSEQKSFEAHVRSQGHEYLVARSWEDVEQCLAKLGEG